MSSASAAKRLNDAIDATVRRAADAGVTIAADQLATMGVGFDYTMVHTAARDWKHVRTRLN